MADFAAKLSLTLQQMYNRVAGCEAGLLSPVAIERGLDLLKKLGYPTPLLNRLPTESFDRTFPLANPLTRITELAPKTIFDLGCGTALDALFCAQILPECELIVGVDSSSGLLNEGRKRLNNFPLHAAKTTLIEADLNQLNRDLRQLGSWNRPNSFDLILMNGSFNLVYDKMNFFHTLTELLSCDGTILIYDFLLIEPLPPGFSDEIDNWLWNVGGALHEDELSRIIRGMDLDLVSVKELEIINPVARCEIIIEKS